VHRGYATSIKNYNMAHVRKDTLTQPLEPAKHLRRFGKQAQARKERRAIRHILRKGED